MLRNTFIAVGLLSISGSALALDEFLSRHKPQVSITIGSGHHNHHNHVYRETRHHDVYYRDTYRHDVYVPRPVHVQPIYYTDRHYYQRNDRHHGGHHHKWKGHKKHHNEWRGHDRDDDDDHDD